MFTCPSEEVEMDKYMVVLTLTMSVFTGSVTAAATGQSINETKDTAEKAKTLMTDGRTCRLPSGQLATKRMRFESENGVAVPKGVEAIPLPVDLQLAGAEVKISTCY